MEASFSFWGGIGREEKALFTHFHRVLGPFVL